MKEEVEDRKREKDAFFLNAVFLLADEWGVTINDVDLDNRILDFDCKWDMRHPFAQKLHELFSEYLI